MRMDKEWYETVDEAFNKAIKYEDIKYIVNESGYDDSKILKEIKEIINDGRDKE